VLLEPEACDRVAAHAVFDLGDEAPAGPSLLRRPSSFVNGARILTGCVDPDRPLGHGRESSGGARRRERTL
jgi:hypothetical protein